MRSGRHRPAFDEMVRQRLCMFAAAALAVAILPIRPHAAGQVTFPLPMISADDPYPAFADFQLADEALERRDYSTAEPLLERAISRLDRPLWPGARICRRSPARASRWCISAGANASKRKR